MTNHSKINSYENFKVVEAIIERDFKAGKLSRERAYQVLNDARKNYRKNSYQKELDRIENK